MASTQALTMEATASKDSTSLKPFSSPFRCKAIKHLLRHLLSLISSNSNYSSSLSSNNNNSSLSSNSQYTSSITSNSLMVSKPKLKCHLSPLPMGFKLSAPCLNLTQCSPLPSISNFPTPISPTTISNLAMTRILMRMMMRTISNLTTPLTINKITFNTNNTNNNFNNLTY